MAVSRSGDRGSRKRRSRSYGKSAKGYVAETFDRVAEAAYDDWAMEVGEKRMQRGMADRKKHSGSTKGRRVARSGVSEAMGGGMRRQSTSAAVSSKPVRKRKANPSNRKASAAKSRTKSAAKKGKARSKSTRTRAR